MQSLVKRHIDEEDVTMTNEKFFTLSEGQLQYLTEKGLLKHIVSNIGKQVQGSGRQKP